MSLQPLRTSLATWAPGARGTADPLHAIAIAWVAIVGPDVAAHSAPISLTHETLAIATRSSAWSQQLQFLSLRIEGGLREHVPGANVARLVFRAGAFRPSVRRASPGAAFARARRRGDVAAYEPAADLADAVERVRARIRAARRASDVACAHCGAPLAPENLAHTCAPCAIARGDDRVLAIERLLFAAPWLAFEELREQLPRLTVAEYERVRRKLLGRWWKALERLRAERRRPSTTERSIASSYLLLQTRLSPERMSPVVAQNALGKELATMLYEAPLPPSGSASVLTRRS